MHFTFAARHHRSSSLSNACVLVLRTALLALLLLAVVTFSPRPSLAADQTDIVFVARAHLVTASGLEGLGHGPAGQFGAALNLSAPGSKLLIRRTDGSLTTLVNGAKPNAANLIDVQSPDVSFDGQKIVFVGATTADPASAQFGFRLYEINADGTGLKKLPVPDRDFSSLPNNNPHGFDFGNQQNYGWHHDLFPAYLADGRIVFASSRYPARSGYDERRAYNLYVFNPQDNSLKRITTERAGVLHPAVLPDGTILLSRWWNAFNQPSAQGVYNKIDARDTNYTLPDGTEILSGSPPSEPPQGKMPDGTAIRRGPNAWHIFSVNPDGTEFQRAAFTPYSDYERTNDTGNDVATAAQPAPILQNNKLYIAYITSPDSTMAHESTATGIRVARPGVASISYNTGGVIAGRGYGAPSTETSHAIHPWGTPDGKILFSYAVGANPALPQTGSFTDPLTGKQFALSGNDLQYKLYTMNLGGGTKTELAVNIGTADALDAKPLVARVGWTAKPDTITTASPDNPTEWNVPRDLFPAEFSFSNKTLATIQTATITNPNVYANAPLELPFIHNSPALGTVARAEVWLDANQFSGAFCYSNYPNPCDTFRQDTHLRAVKFADVPVSPEGAFTAQVPADVPSFLVLRDKKGNALTQWNRGYISIAQGNAYARPGETVRCIGCHFGHVSGSITNENEAVEGWTNISTSATASASSWNQQPDPNSVFAPSHVADRRGFIPFPDDSTRYQDETNGWMSQLNQASGEWIQLQWNKPVKIKSVRLVAPPPVGGDYGGFGDGPDDTPYHVTNATLEFFHKGAPVGTPVQTGQIEPMTNGGTTLDLNTPVTADTVKLTINATEGHYYWSQVAALNEIEVIGMTADGTTNPEPTVTPTPTLPAPCTDAPAAPTLLKPAPNKKLKNTRAKLTWTPVDCATHYIVLVKTAPDAPKTARKRTTETKWKTDSLAPGKYVWQVKACDADTCSASAWQTFRIRPDQ